MLLSSINYVLAPISTALQPPSAHTSTPANFIILTTWKQYCNGLDATHKLNSSKLREPTRSPPDAKSCRPMNCCSISDTYQHDNRSLPPPTACYNLHFHIIDIVVETKMVTALLLQRCAVLLLFRFVLLWFRSDHCCETSVPCFREIWIWTWQ